MFFLAALCIVLLVPSTALAKRGNGKARHVSAISEDNHHLPWRRVPAHSILLKELNSGRVLYQHDSGKRLSPASLTKIMSALVILEHGRLDDLVTVSPAAARAHKTHLRLKAGQVFRLDDLLKAMLIVSANDACLAAVEHVGGDESQFVGLMNDKAAALGVTGIGMMGLMTLMHLLLLLLYRFSDLLWSPIPVRRYCSSGQKSLPIVVCLWHQTHQHRL